jgi:hypothetical protein
MCCLSLKTIEPVGDPSVLAAVYAGARCETPRPVVYPTPLDMLVHEN